MGLHWSVPLNFDGDDERLDLTRSEMMAFRVRDVLRFVEPRKSAKFIQIKARLDIAERLAALEAADWI
jgi:hypothetical protein